MSNDRLKKQDKLLSIKSRDMVCVMSKVRQSGERIWGRPLKTLQLFLKLDLGISIGNWFIDPDLK